MCNLCCYLQSKLSAHGSSSVVHASIGENIPVVDKIVDDGWGSPRSSPQAASSGILCWYIIVYFIVNLLPKVFVLHFTSAQF
jgi:hypothetical protein